MQKVNFKNISSRVSLVIVAAMLAFSMSASAQTEEGGAGDAVAGKTLFNANCAACHKLDKKATGPALRGVAGKYDRDWLYKWISDSQGLIKSGDALAIEIFEANNKSVMTSFPALSNGDIDNILAYTSEPKPEPVVAAVSNTTSGTGGGGMSNNIILAALAFVFLLLMTMLFLVTSTLKKIASHNGVEYAAKEAKKPLWKAFVENQFLMLVSAVLLLLTAAYFMYGFFMQVGVDQGYAPVQPIHYSHRIHAGDNEIDCNYCHSSARKSKHSGIPSLNVCMNCHKNIAEVSEDVYNEGMDEYGVDYNKEIAKLYDAVGWNTETMGYTGESKPVKWVRIHNLPDFAYFNHSQHVTVAGVACQKCHGPVEEMEIMEQFSPLTMGWCIDCHRETNINVAGNEYYEKIHEELSKKYGVEQLTAAQMGGLECGKCHY